ncbi:MAG: hypothetical protein R3A46_16700 [Thermomicrobiales bacterium]
MSSIMVGSVSTLWPVLTPFARDMGASGFQIGMVVGAIYATRLFLQPVIGNFADRHGYRKVLLSARCYTSRSGSSMQRRGNVAVLTPPGSFTASDRRSSCRWSWPSSARTLRQGWSGDGPLQPGPVDGLKWLG